MTQLLIIGGSDAGISAALRARELDATVTPTIVMADDFSNAFPTLVFIAGHYQGEVAKRVNIYATALFHEMTVEAVNDLDLSYTPPLGSPWDAVQMAAQAWSQALHH